MQTTIQPQGKGAGRLAGRATIITGAAQGIGAAYARAMAAEGASVCVCDVRSPDGVVEEIRATGGEAIGQVTDVTDPQALAALVRSTEERYGGVHVLVNNAAIFAHLKPRHFMEIDSQEFNQVLDVNVRGVFECVKAVVPTMKRQKYGKIINIASGTVFKGSPLLLHYVASKGAVIAMTRVLARELGEFGIGVNAIAPGLTMSENVKELYDPSYKVANTNSRCFKREEEPDDVVGAAIFFASAESDFITGQTLLVDGGSAMH